MPLEDILDRIESEADREKEEILRKAREEAERSVEAVRERARVEAVKNLRRSRDEAERLKMQAGAEARLEVRKRLLAQKRNWLEKVPEKTLERLRSGDSGISRRVLGSMIEKHLGEGVTSLTFSGDDAGRQAAEGISSRLKAGAGPPEISIADPDEEPRGGLIIERGRVTVNLSFTDLLEELARRRQIDLQEILFGERDE
jgi:V/A-type H+-transporting ATPase subunit E